MSAHDFRMIRMALACVFGGVLISVTDATGRSLDHLTPEGVRTVIKEDASYSAITGDGASPLQVYAITASGGIEVWGFEKEWGSGNWSSATVVDIGTFTTLTHDGVRPDIVFGAQSNGGILQFEWANQIWNANVVDESPRVYWSLTFDSAHPNRIYAASDEGIYEFTYTDHWIGRLIAPKIYKQLAANGTAEGLKLFGLDEDGHIDQIYFSGTWQTAAVDAQNTYSTITGDAVDSNKVYGALAGGGIKQISYAGSWEVNNVVSGKVYSALASYGSKADAIFAQTGASLQSLAGENQWVPKELSTGQSYWLIVPGAANASDFFGLVNSKEL